MKLSYTEKTLKQISSQIPQRLILIGSLEIFICTAIYFEQTQEQKDKVSPSTTTTSLVLLSVSLVALAFILSVTISTKILNSKQKLEGNSTF